MIMRKLLLSLFAVVAALSMVNATETTFDLTKPELFGYAIPAASAGTNLDDGTLEAGNIVITSKKVASNDTRFWGTAAGVEGIRGYKTSTLTFTTTNGEAITEIKFAGGAISATMLTFDSGTYDSPLWTGSASEVVLTFGGTAKINSITVTTVSATGVQEPKFSPAEGTYYTAQDVTLSCGTADAIIYYTIDGTEPTASSTPYTSSIKVEATTTIKAIAVKGGDKSGIVSATYTIAEPTSVANIAAYNELDKGVVVKFANPVSVIYQNGLYMFVQDATGALQVYGSLEQNYQNGDVIPAGFMGEVAEYGGLIQLAPLAETFAAAMPGTVIEPITVKAQEVTDAMMNKLIKISNASITREGTTRNYTVTDASGEVAVYSRFADVVIPEDDKKYDIKAIVNKYNGNIQLFPIEITEFTGGVGLADTESETPVLAVVAGDKAIKIDATENARVLVVNAVGQVVASESIAAGANTIEVPAGFYVVRVNDTVTKVIIK